MANKPRSKMPIEDRAKQFMPFAALKGLPEALAAKEKAVSPKYELSKEMPDDPEITFPSEMPDTSL